MNSPVPQFSNSPIPIVVALAAILVRLPFLFKANAFFNADEAVHGLMAHHLGEFPLFFWGQGYKGVPEVYFEGAIFALFGNGIVQLKSLSLVIWGVGAGATTYVAQIWHGTTGAIIAAALMIVGPAALVPWTLSGDVASAWMAVIVALLLVDFQRGLDGTPGGVPPRVWFWCALGLWIHPVAACLFPAVAAIGVVRSGAWSNRQRLIDVLLARSQPAPWRAALLVLHVAIAVLVLMFTYTFAGGRLDVGPIRASHPQRSIRAIALLTGLTIVIHALRSTSAGKRRTLASLGWLAAGLAPILVQVIRGGGFGTPVITRGLSDMPWIVRGIGTDILSLAAGVRDSDGGALGAPWWSVTALSVATGVYVTSFGRALLRRDSAANLLSTLFPGLLLLTVFGLLTLGGGFSGPPSVRYVFCFYGLVALMAADGFTRVVRWNRLAGAALVVLCLGTFAFGEIRWWRKLQPDSSPVAMVECLEQHGRRFAVADYWIAYPLTFISDERVLVVPENAAEDRYLPYRRKVEAAPDRVRVVAVNSRDLVGGLDLCRTPGLRAH